MTIIRFKLIKTIIFNEIYSLKYINYNLKT